MSKMTTTNDKTAFEFEYDVRCIKTYTETHTFTRSDVEEWVRDESLFDFYDGDLAIDWEMLTAEEQEAFFKYFAEHYSHSDQCDEEHRNPSHDYEGECGYDEDYEDSPDSLLEQWGVCRDGWVEEYAPIVKARIATLPMVFANDDGLKRTLTIDEYFAHEDYEGEDKVWLQLEDEVLGIHRHKQIWVKPEARVEPTAEERLTARVAELEARETALMARVAELEALVAKKDKQIKALVAVE